MRGNLSFLKVPDPEAYERANYMLMQTDVAERVVPRTHRREINGR
jgi:hypothetical protein